MNSVYHRPFFLRPEVVSFGYGATSMCATIDFGRTASSRKLQATILWPPPGSWNVPYAFYSARETPNPVPGTSIVGSPVSLVRTSTINRLVATMTGPDGEVPSVTLTHSNDHSKLVRPGEAHLIPRAPLSPNTEYLARFQVGAEVFETKFRTAPSLQ
jgi:hypothetical protein